MAATEQATRQTPRPIDTINLDRRQQQSAYRLMKWTLDYLYHLEYCFNCEPDTVMEGIRANSPKLITQLSMFVRDVAGSERDEQGNSYFF